MARRTLACAGLGMKFAKGTAKGNKLPCPRHKGATEKRWDNDLLRTLAHIHTQIHTHTRIHTDDTHRVTHATAGQKG